MNKFLFVFMTLALCIAACSHNDRNVKIQDENDSNNELVIPTGDGIIPNAVTDIDGNTYKAVKLGDQIWMAENLKTKRYADGTSIYAGAGESESDDVGYWYYPDDQESDMSTYGLHYNWKAVVRNLDTVNCSYKDSISRMGKWRIYRNLNDIQGICPNGWHVPSDAEWTQLTNYVSSQDKYVCGDDRKNIAKALASTTNWAKSEGKCEVGHDKVLNNSTGFNAMPGGSKWSFSVKFWSSTSLLSPWGTMYAFCRDITAWNPNVEKCSHSGIYPVRCISDNNR